MSALSLYNTLSRKKEVFTPIQDSMVGIYVCGPTVYGEPHLGHARTYVAFDVVYRYFLHLGYKVRYVRNITDVGHLENDADEGEDKIAKKARLEKIEPMEVAHHYTVTFHEAMQKLNLLSPSIEPAASGHIIEQIAMIQKILDKGMAYVSNGSVYFDISKYDKKYDYGILSGRVLEELIAGAGNERRELEGQEEKRNRVDFALWKRAEPQHIMRWPSPWGEGFPGWHIECSVMSGKYLGETFDIHAGGMDLLFPHHECEIAQSQAANGKAPARYWMHANMLTVNGQKMGKSLNNFINLSQVFSGSHPLLEQAYSPMAVRFFILQAHYRSTVDFSNAALQAAHKGYTRLMNAYRQISNIQAGSKSDMDVKKWADECYEVMNDDFNSPMLIAKLFEAVSFINEAVEKRKSLNAEDLQFLKEKMRAFIIDVLGLQEEESGAETETLDGLLQIIIKLRQQVRENKDFKTSDYIRDGLGELGISLKDGKEGTSWELKG